MKRKPERKKTIIIALTAAILVCAVAIVSVIVINSKALVVEIEENAVVNINETVDNYQFVKMLKNGKIITEKTAIDTSSLGEREVTLIIKSDLGKEKEFTYKVSVVDNESPKINCPAGLQVNLGKETDLLKGVSASDNSKEEIAVTVEGTYDFNKIGEYKLKYIASDSSGNRAESDLILSVADLESPKIKFKDYIETTKGKKINLLDGVSASDNSGEKITVAVEGSYDINKAGKYALKYTAVDSSGNKTEEKFTFRVKDPSDDSSDNDSGKTVTFTTSKGFKGETKNGVTYIDGYLIANKTYSLPKSYGNGLTSKMQSAFKTMRAAAKKDGLNIYISSGYRSYSTQKRIYNRYVKEDGRKKADTYSARPGHSEHQSGLAADLNIIGDEFAGTPEAKWLNANCYKYGFILRYPKGKTDETGYKYEPWHFRYVGVELATKLYNNGDWITMEDYFGITSQYQ